MSGLPTVASLLQEQDAALGPCREAAVIGSHDADVARLREHLVDLKRIG